MTKRLAARVVGWRSTTRPSSVCVRRVRATWPGGMQATVPRRELVRRRRSIAARSAGDLKRARRVAAPAWRFLEVRPKFGRTSHGVSSTLTGTFGGIATAQVGAPRSATTNTPDDERIDCDSCEAGHQHGRTHPDLARSRLHGDDGRADRNASLALRKDSVDGAYRLQPRLVDDAQPGTL